MLFFTNFNPRARTGHDSSLRETKKRLLTFQSTCPHGARHSWCVFCSSSHGISIHVPARGTTRQTRRLTCRSQISIHVPARGTTSENWGSIEVVHNFNPRARTGHDINPWLKTQGYEISIHVPARGTTQPVAQDSRLRDFNPRARTGHDRVGGGTECGPEDFNPRARTGHDLCRRLIFAIVSYFNPRARTGHDAARKAALTSGKIFQSTCPHGARLFR